MSWPRPYLIVSVTVTSQVQRSTARQRMRREETNSGSKKRLFLPRHTVGVQYSKPQVVPRSSQ